MQQLEDLPNIGKTIAVKLRALEIDTPLKLRQPIVINMLSTTGWYPTTCRLIIEQRPSNNFS